MPTSLLDKKRDAARQRKWYHARNAKGLCRFCDEPNVFGKTAKGESMRVAKAFAWVAVIFMLMTAACIILGRV